MKLVVKRATPAAVAALRQATAFWPKRKKASDGLLPSSAHIKQSPNSDHNTGLAVDITHDPDNGVDCLDIYKRLQADRRVKYLIFKGKIWNQVDGERVYNGLNKHNKHLHISIKDQYAKDDSNWFGWMGEVPKKLTLPKPLPKKKQEKQVRSKYTVFILIKFLQ